MNGFIVSRLIKLIAKFGVKVVLEGLIEVTSRYHDDAMRQLTKDLTAALHNYERKSKK